MEYACNALQNFLVSEEVNKNIDFISEEKTVLNKLTLNNCFLESVDLEQKRGKTLCFICPDEQDFQETAIASMDSITAIDLFIFVSGEPPSVLQRKALRYGAAIKKSCFANHTLNNQVTDIEIIKIEYFDSIENRDHSVRGILMKLNIVSEEMEV